MEAFYEPSIKISESVLRLQENIEKWGGDPNDDAYYGPITTHLMYMGAETIPHLSEEETVIRRYRLRQLGYRVAAGVILSSWDTPVKQALGYLEAPTLALLNQNLMFLGPYCLSDEIALPGLMAYEYNRE